MLNLQPLELYLRGPTMTLNILQSLFWQYYSDQKGTAILIATYQLENILERNPKKTSKQKIFKINPQK